MACQPSAALPVAASGDTMRPGMPRPPALHVEYLDPLTHTALHVHIRQTILKLPARTAEGVTHSKQLGL